MTATDLPTSSKVVVIGGGIVGCSTAYHLAAMGCETLLLEQHKLTSGSTFHAAGLVGQLRTSANITQLLGESVALYDRLETETGLATGWKMNGGLRLACNPDRWIEVKRQATAARSFGLDMQLLTPSEAQQLWPLMNIDDVVGAAFLPTDGQANPSDVTQALARGARNHGAVITEDTAVLELVIERGELRGVVTAEGTIACEKVVLCAGQWTRAFGARYGINVPLVSVQHQYMITEAIEGVTSTLPTLRDPDRLTYYKEEVGGLVMGGYEPNPIPWAVEGIPDGFHYTLLDSDFNHFEPMLALSLGRVPALADAGIKSLTNGPESFTPDGNFILGEAPEQKNVFIGAGFNAFGIASGGGAGMALAEWVINGEPATDLWPVDIRRFGHNHRDTDWVRSRTLEAYKKHYTMAWPSEEHESARPCRRSPLYRTLQEQGACFGEKLGWERPNWFADVGAGEVAKDEYSFVRPNWFSSTAREHHAARTAAVLIDQTSFAKFCLKGSDAERVLGWLAANNTAKPVGSLTYTQLLNDRGGIQCDLTVARIADDEFYIVTGTGFATHDFHWIASNIPADADAHLSDVTSAFSVLTLMGPRAREILAKVTSAKLDNTHFPFGRVQTVGIAGCSVRALRVTYIGELGWELHCPTDVAQTVYDALLQVGPSYGLVNAGYRCIESCRLEKGYRAWGSDIGPDHTPLEAGLGWAVRDAAVGVKFKGQDALEQQRKTGVKKRLATFSIDDPDFALMGRETIYRDGERVGWLSSGGYGHHVNLGIGLGYVRSSKPITTDFVMTGSYELEVAMQRIPCQVHMSPLYDPKGLAPKQ